MRIFKKQQSQTGEGRGTLCVTLYASKWLSSPWIEQGAHEVPQSLAQRLDCSHRAVGKGSPKHFICSWRWCMDLNHCMLHPKIALEKWAWCSSTENELPISDVSLTREMTQFILSLYHLSFRQIWSYTRGITMPIQSTHETYGIMISPWRSKCEGIYQGNCLDR